MKDLFKIGSFFKEPQYDVKLKEMDAKVDDEKKVEESEEDKEKLMGQKEGGEIKKANDSAGGAASPAELDGGKDTSVKKEADGDSDLELKDEKSDEEKVSESEEEDEKKKEECGTKEANVKEADADHSDAEQDKELIKKMIADTFSGQEEMSSEEVMEMCKEVYGAFNEMGMPGDKAMAATGNVMKYAKYLADKGLNKEEIEDKVDDKVDDKVEAEEEKMQDEKPAEESSEEMIDKAEKKEESSHEDPEKKVEESDEEKKDDEVKESDKVLALKAEIARLKENERKTKVKDHLENTLKESGLPRSVTSVFREHLGEPKSTKDIDDKFKLFVETYKAASEGSGTNETLFVTTIEKKNGAGKTSKAISFGDCLN